MPTRSGAVHVATTTRRYKDTVYTSHLLRRTYREGGKVKHQTLGNISHLPAHTIELIKGPLRGETYVPSSQALEIVRSLVSSLGMSRGVGTSAPDCDAMLNVLKKKNAGLYDALAMYKCGASSPLGLPESADLYWMAFQILESGRPIPARGSCGCS